MLNRGGGVGEARYHKSIVFIILLVLILNFIYLIVGIYNFNPIIEKISVPFHEIPSLSGRHEQSSLCEGFLYDASTVPQSMIRVEPEGLICNISGKPVYRSVSILINISRDNYIFDNILFYYVNNSKIVVRVEKPVNGTAFMIMSASDTIVTLDLSREGEAHLEGYHGLVAISIVVDGSSFNGREVFRVGFYASP